MSTGRISELLFNEPLIRNSWYALRRIFRPSSTVPVRDHPTYQTMIWGSADARALKRDVPKLIWSYWEGNPSVTVQSCVASWKKYNPRHAINVVSESRIRDFLPEFPELPKGTPPQKVSNLVRLMLIEKFGGYWMDASTLITVPLDWIESELTSSKCESLMFWNERSGIYRRDVRSPIIENGFICAPPNSNFIKEWREAYQECIVSNDYKSYFSEKSNYDELSRNFLENDSNKVSYFVCYLAAQLVMQKSNNYRLLLINSEDEFYYYYYGTRKPRNRRLFAEALLLAPAESSDRSKIIKITKGHRSLLDDYISHGCFRNDSLLGKHVTASQRPTTVYE